MTVTLRSLLPLLSSTTGKRQKSSIEEHNLHITSRESYTNSTIQRPVYEDLNQDREDPIILCAGLSHLAFSLST